MPLSRCRKTAAFRKSRHVVNVALRGTATGSASDAMAARAVLLPLLFAVRSALPAGPLFQVSRVDKTEQRFAWKLRDPTICARKCMAASPAARRFIGH